MKAKDSVSTGKHYNNSLAATGRFETILLSKITPQSTGIFVWMRESEHGMIATLLLVIIYISFISLGLPDSLLGSAWPVMYGGMGVPVSSAGIVSMIIAGGSVISSIFSEKLIKRFGTGLVTVFSVLMTAVALFGFSLRGGFVALCLCAVPLGLGAGSIDAALNNYVSLHFKAKHMSWLHCFWGIGAATGPVIMSFYLLRAGSWTSGYRAVSIIQAVLVVLLLLSLPLWGKVGRSATQPQEAGRPILKFMQLLRLPGAKPALISFFCYCAMESTVGLWGSSYLVIIKGIAPETAAQWIALYYTGITFGRFLSGFLTMKLNNRRMVRLGEGLLAAGILLLILPFGAVTLWGGFFLIGLGCAPIFPSLLHETPVNFGQENSQAVMGLQMACAYVGITVMPLLFGVLASRVSHILFPVFLTAMLLVMATMVYTLNKKVDAAHKRSSENSEPPVANENFCS